MTIMWTVLASLMDNHHDNTSGHLLELWMNGPYMVSTVLVPVSILKSKLEVHRRLSIKIISVILRVEMDFNTFSILMIHSGTVRDVGVPVLAAN